MARVPGVKKAVAKKAAVKKAVAKKATAKKATAKRTTAAGHTNATIQAAIKKAVDEAVQKEREEHAAWKNQFVREAIDFAEQEGYCDEVENFLEDQGFDLEAFRAPVKFQVSLSVEVDAGTRGNAENLRESVRDHLNSYNVERDMASSMDVDGVSIYALSVTPASD
jgi:hypothetical protein